MAYRDSDSSDDESTSGPYGGFGLCCQCVPAGSVGVVQFFGDFQGYAEPGIMTYCWPIHSVRNVSLAVKQIDCQTDCKTLDNVIVQIQTAVQYRIDKLRIKKAVFEIRDPEAQIRASIDNVVRSSVPLMDLDATYANKESLCLSIQDSVASMMAPHGYLVLNALITDLSPDKAVMKAMNEINAARRKREAAVEQGEAQKTLLVKAAEADAEAKYLSGVGVANMRKAIADGFKDSIVAMSDGGLTHQESMDMMITTQYLDTLKDFAQNPSTSSIMVPQGTGAGKTFEAQVRDGFVASSALTRSPPQAIMDRSTAI